MTKRKHLAKEVQLENVAIANALQLEAARHSTVPIRFNFVAHAKFELAQPIRCRQSVFTADTLHSQRNRGEAGLLHIFYVKGQSSWSRGQSSRSLRNVTYQYITL